MKKAKVFLTAAGLIAAVGGAFALKANMREGELFCNTTKQVSGTCNIKATKVGELNEYLYCTVGAGSTCTKYTRIVRDI